VERAVTDLFQEPGDATPLDPEERDGLVQSWITHRRDLNEAEEENIAKGAAWARASRNRKPEDLLTDEFAKSLHKRMFGDVWRWAGSYRQTGKSIGIEANRIPVEVPMMFGNVRFWAEHKTFPPDDIAMRLHQSLAFIHPFPNGNGRHARLMADLLIEKLGGQTFTWGGDSLADVGQLRTKYITALKAADDHDLEPLLAFARS
jgi:Fic-DOC domain mobile mystery protein B